MHTTTKKTNLVDTAVLETIRVIITCVTLMAIAVAALHIVANLVVSVSHGQAQLTATKVTRTISTAVRDSWKSLRPTTSTASMPSAIS